MYANDLKLFRTISNRSECAYLVDNMAGFIVFNTYIIDNENLQMIHKTDLGVIHMQSTTIKGFKNHGFIIDSLGPVPTKTYIY